MFDYKLVKHSVCYILCLFQVAKCHIKLDLKNDSFTELRGEIAGPPDTPYEGATYVLDIKIPETYPFNPPKVCVCILFCGFKKTCMAFYFGNAK